MRKIVKYLDEHIKSIILIGIVLIIFLLSTIYFPSRARYTRLDDGALVVQATAVIKKPPILTISYSDNEITKDDILVTIESNEEIKQPTGWTISSDKKIITKTYTENVNETLGVYDLYDNKTDAVIEINNIDKTKPVITSSFFPLKTSSTSVSVNLKWTENDMVTEYCISDSDSSCTNWVTIESPSNTKTSITTTYTLPNSEAKYTRYAFVKDRAGNISEAKSDYVFYDNTNPTITITRTDYNTFSWSASDANGISGYKVTTTSETPTSWVTGGTLTSGTYDIGTDSKYYVHVKDAAGNTNYSSINTYQLTKTEGTGTTLTIKENSSSGTTITSSTRVLNNTVIYVSVAAKSGYENAKVTIAGSAFTSGGTYTINSSVEVKSSATVSDSEDPTVTISLSDYNTFSWTARDNKAVTGYAVTTSNSTPTSWTTSGTLTSGTYNINTNTSYYVYAKDAAGNIGYAKIDAYKITKSQGSGTTLTIKENNASGTTLTGSTLYVLSGTKLYITGSTSTGYCSGTYKIGSTSFASAVTHTVSASVTISSSASYCVPSQPTITASDGKGSSTWHNSSFTLTFSSTISSGSVKYYYSNSPLSQTNEASSLSISTATQTDFYVKACNALDTSVCSSVAYYAAKLDSSPPGISSLGGKDTDTITVTATDTPAGIMGYCFAKSQSSCSANSSFGSSNTKTFSSSSDAGTWYVCVRDNASNDNCVSFQVDTATEQGEFSQSKYDTCVDNYTGGQGINSYCSKQYENASSQCNKDCVDPCKSSCNGGADAQCMSGCMGNCVRSCMTAVGDNCSTGIENGCKSQAYETITIYKVNY